MTRLCSEFHLVQYTKQRNQAVRVLKTARKSRITPSGQAVNQAIQHEGLGHINFLAFLSFAVYSCDICSSGRAKGSRPISDPRIKPFA